MRVDSKRASTTAANSSHIKWISAVRTYFTPASQLENAIGACLCLSLHQWCCSCAAAATATAWATGSTKGNNELRANASARVNNAHKVDPNGNSCCCCCAILIPWLPFDSPNNKKREPLLRHTHAPRRFALSLWSLTALAVKLHTQSLRVSSNVRFGLARTLPVEKKRKNSPNEWNLEFVKCERNIIIIYMFRCNLCMLRLSPACDVRAHLCEKWKKKEKRNKRRTKMHVVHAK